MIDLTGWRTVCDGLFLMGVTRSQLVTVDIKVTQTIRIS
jgi:hypothetical protein